MRSRVGWAAVFIGLACATGPTSHAGTAKTAAGPYTVVKTIPDGDAFWDYAMFVAAEKRVYIAREDGVSVIDIATGKFTERFVAAQQGHAVVALSGGRALVTNGASDTATVFDRRTGKVLRTIATDKKPDGAILDPATGQILIMNGVSDDALFVNPDTGSVLGRVALDGEPGSPVVDGNGRLYVNVTDHSEITVIDTAARKVITKYPLPQCDDASALALDKFSGVLLAGCANLKAIAIRASTGEILGSVAIAKYPDVIIFDEVRKVFYVPCVIPGTLDVIGEGEGGAPEVVASVPAAFGVHTGALDAAGGRLYLPAGDLRLVKGSRPSVAPGTFRVLVIDVNRGAPKSRKSTP